MLSSVVLTSTIEKGGSHRCALPKESAALFSVFADYFGLAVAIPALPFFLGTLGVVNIEVWTGAIVTTQFVAVVIGNNIWGIFSDKFGARLAMQVTMLGCALFFGLSAAAVTPASLVAIRFGAGIFSPLVPALTYMFSVLKPSETIAGMGKYVVSITASYFAGAAVVGAAFEAVGWMGISLITAAVALCSGLFVSTQPAAPSRAARGLTSGVSAALRSPEFVAHAATAFSMGYAMNMILVVCVLELKQFFGFSVRQVANVFFGVPVVTVVCSLWAVPKAVQTIGTERTISIGVVLMLAASVLCSTPAARLSPGVFIAAIMVAILAMSFEQNPNQALVRSISDRHTVNGIGAVVGVSRTCWALGQAVSPLISLALYATVGHWAPWACFAALQLAVIALYRSLRVPLWPPAKVQTPRSPSSGAVVIEVESHATSKPENATDDASDQDSEQSHDLKASSETSVDQATQHCSKEQGGQHLPLSVTV